MSRWSAGNGRKVIGIRVLWMRWYWCWVWVVMSPRIGRWVTSEGHAAFSAVAACWEVPVAFGAVGHGLGGSIMAFAREGGSMRFVFVRFGWG
ncbi:MAG: hypothetical protein FWD57_14945 [Polyangiaceae bacterium]|nr:hypothetical protein [Polyangiaceae bacterium]